MMYRLLILVLLLSGCCPKITEQPPQIRIDSFIDTIYRYQPPIIIPADESEISFSISDICDSIWRANNPIKQSSGKRLKVSGSFSGDSVKFHCREAALIIERDSILEVLKQVRIQETQKTIVEVCPSGWPKWMHPLISVLAFLGLLFIGYLILKFTPF
jgi:hypothetical protein